MNQGSDAPSLAFLIERSAEVKLHLVDFACSLRFERHLERFMPEGAGPEPVLDKGEAIGLRSETIAPLPFRRLAAAHPQTVDAVFRRVLRKPDFS